MITEKDLIEAIAECQGERNPNANTCIKLAAFYTIKNELFGKPEQSPVAAENATPTYSYAAPPAEPVETTIDYYSDTDFSRAIDGRPAAEIWPIMDDLMNTLQMLQPRIYDAVMRNLQK